MKYENYKQLALKEKDEKEAKTRELETLRKERAAKNQEDPKKDHDND